jgi:hypothetical protein
MGRQGNLAYRFSIAFGSRLRYLIRRSYICFVDSHTMRLRALNIFVASPVFSRAPMEPEPAPCGALLHSVGGFVNTAADGRPTALSQSLIRDKDGNNDPICTDAELDDVGKKLFLASKYQENLNWDVYRDRVVTGIWGNKELLLNRQLTNAVTGALNRDLDDVDRKIEVEKVLEVAESAIKFQNQVNQVLEGRKCETVDPCPGIVGSTCNHAIKLCPVCGKCDLTRTQHLAFDDLKDAYPLLMQWLHQEGSSESAGPPIPDYRLTGVEVDNANIRRLLVSLSLSDRLLKQCTDCKKERRNSLYKSLGYTSAKQLQVAQIRYERMMNLIDFDWKSEDEIYRFMACDAYFMLRNPESDEKHFNSWRASDPTCLKLFTMDRFALLQSSTKVSESDKRKIYLALSAFQVHSICEEPGGALSKSLYAVIDRTWDEDRLIMNHVNKTDSLANQKCAELNVKLTEFKTIDDTTTIEYMDKLEQFRLDVGSTFIWLVSKYVWDTKSITDGRFVSVIADSFDLTLEQIFKAPEPRNVWVERFQNSVKPLMQQITKIGMIDDTRRFEIAERLANAMRRLWYALNPSMCEHTEELDSDLFKLIEEEHIMKHIPEEDEFAADKCKDLNDEIQKLESLDESGEGYDVIVSKLRTDMKTIYIWLITKYGRDGTQEKVAQKIAEFIEMDPGALRDSEILERIQKPSCSASATTEGSSDCLTDEKRFDQAVVLLSTLTGA